MGFLILLAAAMVGIDAADKLNVAHPLPSAWFEAGITLALIIGGMLLILVRGDDD